MKTLCQRKLLLFCILVLGQAVRGFGQETPAPAPAPDLSGYGPAPEFVESSGSFPSMLNLGRQTPFGAFIITDTRIGQNYGFEDSYQNGRVFLPLHLQPGTNMFFGSLGGSVDADGDFAGNFGGGYRHFVREAQRIYGISGWYDIDDSGNQTYERVGVSLETMGQYFDVRANGYVVISEDRDVLSQGLDILYRGRSLLFNDFLIAENAYSGGDVEIGGLMPGLGRYGVYGYLGGYHLTSDEGGDTTGVSLRSNTVVTENFNVGTTFTYDEKFGSNFFTNLVFTFPMKRPKRLFSPKTMIQRLAEPVERTQRIPVHIEREDNFSLAVDSKTNRAIQVLHVDPNNTQSGDGSFENPYRDVNSLHADNNSDISIIRIIPHDLNTGINLALSQTLELYDFQRLLGASLPHNVLTTRGSFSLPGLVSGERPVLSHAGGGDIVRLADCNEVSGFFFQGNALTAGRAIVGNEIDTFNINRNIDPDARLGVDLVDAVGVGLISNNIFRGNREGGVRIANNTNANGPLSLTVVNNDFETNGGAGLNVILRNDAKAAVTVDGNIVQNTLDDNTEDTRVAGDALAFQLEGSTNLENATAEFTELFITNNIIGSDTDTEWGNDRHGIFIHWEEETNLQDVFIANNLISRNGRFNSTLVDDRFSGGDGIHFRRLDNATLTRSGRYDSITSPATIYANSIINNGFGATIATPTGFNPVTETNTITGTASIYGNGIGIRASEGGEDRLDFEILDNDIYTNNRYGISMYVQADARIKADIRRNLINQNGLTGIYTSERIGAEADLREIGGTWMANRIIGNGVGGVTGDYLTGGGGIRLDATVTNIFNVIDPDEDAGRLNILGNLIADNGLDGIEINAGGRILIDSNEIKNNGTNAGASLSSEQALLVLSDTGVEVFDTVRGRIVGEDNGNGIDINAVMRGNNGYIYNQAAYEPEDMVSPTFFGVYTPLQTTTPLFVEIYRNSVRENRNDGLEIRHANNPSELHDAPLHAGHFPVNVVARDNTIETNGGRGVDILNQGGGRTPENVNDFLPETGANTSVNPPNSTVAGTSNQFSPTDTTISLVGNKIASNAKEGIYVVNTASLTQGQAGNTPIPGGEPLLNDTEDPTRGLNNDGEIDSVARLALEVDGNLVIKNGQQLGTDSESEQNIDTITGSGLVIRVGTQDQGAVSLLAETVPNTNPVQILAFRDFASAPAGFANADVSLYGETGFRNADEILALTTEEYQTLGFFNILQPGGVIGKVTNNGLDESGNFDPYTGFEGNFGSDVYIESFTSTPSGGANPVIARFDLLFENNRGDALDVTNFGAFYGAGGSRENAQRLAGAANSGSLFQPILGRVVGVHRGAVFDFDPNDTNPSTTQFDVLDELDPGANTPIDDRTGGIYDGLLVEFGVNQLSSATAAGYASSTIVDKGNLTDIDPNTPGPQRGSRFTVAPAFGTPQTGAFQIQLSRPDVFDVVYIDPATGNPLTAAQVAGLAGTGTLGGQNLVVRFLDEIDYNGDGTDNAFDDTLQPTAAINAAPTLVNNWLLNNGQVPANPTPADLANPNRFHVDGTNVVDNIGIGVRAGETAVASSGEQLPTGTTAQNTLQVAGSAVAPRDGNLFIITQAFGSGPSSFRVSGAQTGPNIGVETNQFTTGNLGFDDAVSLESGGASTTNELPFEWDELPTDNRQRILDIFESYNRGPLPNAPIETFRDWQRDGR
ncbi:inverse autotransporter beta domain-containing protein [Thalassoroseus pseudoceratinae]|uniref:inverse autotransporter beta domain-containing protein n=1 Tax=Thalassoroseus pseudoceratinae TaxID=2713176 RepID=UPI00141E1981|nr:inverse autotransporter beta domain-containing protein [Thalassoroseus pseudoceratinae]